MPLIVVVMGVSGCGKSTVGRQLAQALPATFLDADDFHPPANVERMRAGIALTDAERAPWLDALAARLMQARARDEAVVLACSALKRSYRDALRRGAPQLTLVHLTGSPALLAERITARPGHYMPPSLLASQLATLEVPAPDEHALTLDVALPTAALVAAALDPLQKPMNTTPVFTKVILETGTDGRARFRDEAIALTEGKPAARLSPLLPSGGYQLRESPVGFRSEFHCTENPQWLFVLQGAMEIGLQDGTTRTFRPGDAFYSNDTLPAGAAFDAKLHGHWSRQVGAEPLVTLFVRA
jgi:carbohydrate kinase (thermoresistant glucokinase family)